VRSACGSASMPAASPEGKLTLDLARREIAAMEAVLETLRGLKPGAAPELPL